MKFSYADGGFSANDLKGLFGEFDNMSSMAKSVTTRTNGIYSTVTTLIQTYQNMLNSSIRMISDTAIRG